MTQTALQTHEAIVRDTNPRRFLNPATHYMFEAIPEAFGHLDGFVYVICPPEGRPVKIGKTASCLKYRLSDLQMGNWTQISYGAAVGIYEASIDGVEKVAHQLAAKKFKRLRGEWFDASAEEALEVVLEAAERAGATVRSPDQAYSDGLFHAMAYSDECRKGEEQLHEERRAILRRKLGMD